MKTEEKRAALEEIVKKYPRRESAILPALYFMQKHNNNMLAEQDIKDVADILGVSVSHTFGVATYYTMFNKKPVGRYHLQVDTNISAMLMGAEEIVSHLEKRLGVNARIAHYGPASTHANLTRPNIRAQSILKPKDSLLANEEESIYGHSTTELTGFYAAQRSKNPVQ